MWRDAIAGAFVCRRGEGALARPPAPPARDPPLPPQTEDRRLCAAPRPGSLQRPRQVLGQPWSVRGQLVLRFPSLGPAPVRPVLPDAWLEPLALAWTQQFSS